MALVEHPIDGFVINKNNLNLLFNLCILPLDKTIEFLLSRPKATSDPIEFEIFSICFFFLVIIFFFLKNT